MLFIISWLNLWQIFDMKSYFFIASRPHMPYLSRFSVLTAQMLNRFLHELFPSSHLPINHQENGSVWTHNYLHCSSETTKLNYFSLKTTGGQMDRWRAGKHKPRIKGQAGSPGATLAVLLVYRWPLILTARARTNVRLLRCGLGDIFKNSFSVASHPQRHLRAPLAHVTCGTWAPWAKQEIGIGVFDM